MIGNENGTGTGTETESLERTGIEVIVTGVTVTEKVIARHRSETMGEETGGESGRTGIGTEIEIEIGRIVVGEMVIAIGEDEPEC